MAVRDVGARWFAGREPVVELSPMIGTSVSRIDAELIDGIDHLEHALDLGPAGQAEQNLAARPHKWHGRESFAGRARRMSIRETTVPKSFAAHRT
jgi:hypothetical protein